MRTLSELEGVNFDLKGQRAFFGLQIKKRLYKPTKSKLAEADLIRAVYDEDPSDLDDVVVERILAMYDDDSVDASGRGRTPAGILNRFGLCVALHSKGPVVITELGKKWLSGAIQDEELFTKFFLKWQYPNPIETGYDGFDIKPFIGLLSLIQSVNKKWGARGNKPVGISKLEYLLFVPSLTKKGSIEDYAQRIIQFRQEIKNRLGKERSDFINSFAQARAQSIYGSSKRTNTAMSDLRDYTDSSIRYFRMSGIISLRGGDTHIDIARDKEVEAQSIVNTIDAASKNFDNYDSYLEYLSNETSLTLPWQNEDDLKEISTHLSTLLHEEAQEVHLDDQNIINAIQQKSTSEQVSSLHSALNDVRIEKLRGLKHDLSVLDDCINKLTAITGKNYETLTARPSLDLEWYVTRAMMVLNDALHIAPSFSIGDDGLPTGFRANVSDIECYYQTFGMTLEVTLLLGRDQWIAEGQPVMRHFRDFEDKLGDQDSYCLFIAPFIHRDTLNTFWGSIKLSYEGKRQNIIPLSLAQFIQLLGLAKKKLYRDKLNHIELRKLLELLCNAANSYDNSQDWLAELPSYIDSWE